MINIFYNEWRCFLRNKLFIFFTSFFIILLIVVTYFAIIQNNKQIQSQNEAHNHIRSQWDEIDSTNAHSAAHFGTYAFKSNTILNSLDEGINSVTGVVLRLEGHKQNDVAFSEISQSLEISKFGKLKPSLLFQFIIPLFLIFLSFNSYTSEIASGRLKLLIIQGDSLLKIVFAKIVTILSLSFLLLFLSIFIQYTFNFSSLSFDEILRLVIFFFAYIIYYFIIITLTILLSILFKKSISSLSTMIIVWLLWTVFLPKTIGNFTESISPLPTRFELKSDMKEDRSKGIDGHNPSDERRYQLEKETLEKYNVDSLSQLPINFSGILLQADEEYGNKVWDKHFGNVYSILKEQKRNYQLSGLINPFASIQSLSTGSCGTDLIHHLDFLSKAEIYRRYFVKKLNNEYTFVSTKGENAYLSDNVFFKSINDFNYSTPNFSSVLYYYLYDIIFLFSWILFLIFFVILKSRKLII
ncbi:MAG: hypothetical protein CMD02_04720 [Flavobacteriales bacterium]|nr:hypothetical protein [Flavobacteriales bacterium]|tara:strand:- start:7177 stop:8580 length:1404 start_codon:yes stop_codon:yes gene_type:complete